MGFYLLMVLLSQLILGVILSFGIPLKNSLAVLLAYLMVIILAYKIREFDILTLFRGINPKTLFIVILGSIVFNLIIRFGKVFLDDSFFEINSNPDYFFAALFLAPFFQEIFFRGIMLKELNSIINNTPVSIVLVSLVFGAIHMNFTGLDGDIYRGFSIFLFSVILCLLMVKYRNTWYCIIFHSTYNLISLLTQTYKVLGCQGNLNLFPKIYFWVLFHYN